MDGSADIKTEPEPEEGVVAERRSSRLREKKDEDNYEVTLAGMSDLDPRKRIKNPILLEKVNQFLRDVGTDPDEIDFEEMEAEADWTYYEPKMAQDTENVGVGDEEEVAEYYEPLPEGSVIVKIENEDHDTEQPHDYECLQSNVILKMENVHEVESNESELFDGSSVFVNLEVEADAKQQNGSEVLDVVVNSDNTGAEQQFQNGPFDEPQPDVDINDIDYV